MHPNFGDNHGTNMKIPTRTVLVMVAAGTLACTGARATTITWTFFEHGGDKVLGPVSTFTADGYGLTVYGFKDGPTATPADLYAKYSASDPEDEEGLGLVDDFDRDFEIDPAHFVQLDARIGSGVTVSRLALKSIQTGEPAGIFGSNTLGELGTRLTVLSSDTGFDLAPFAGKFRFFGVTDVGHFASADVLISSLSATVSVPDGGTNGLLLGLGLLGVGLAARRLRN